MGEAKKGPWGDPRYPEIIDRPIRNIQELSSAVIDNAIERVMALPWSNLGGANSLPTIRQTARAFAYIAIAHNTPDLPIGVFSDNTSVNNSYLQNVPSNHKQKRGENFWLIMHGDLSGEEATHLRDFLWLKIPEMLAGTYEDWSSIPWDKVDATRETHFIVRDAIAEMQQKERHSAQALRRYTEVIKNGRFSW